MARAMSADFLQSYRFTVSFGGANAGVPFNGQPEGLPSDKTEAAFNTVTVPEVTVEGVEYNEGMRTNRYKLPGLPTYSDLTMTRGVVLTDSMMFKWIQAMLNGENYRADITIKHHDKAGKVQRAYVAHEAFPIRCKLAGDFDASSSEVSIQEMDVSYESITLLASPEAKTSIHIGE